MSAVKKERQPDTYMQVVPLESAPVAEPAAQPAKAPQPAPVPVGLPVGPVALAAGELGVVGASALYAAVGVAGLATAGAAVGAVAAAGAGYALWRRSGPVAQRSLISSRLRRAPSGTGGGAGKAGRGLGSGAGRGPAMGRAKAVRPSSRSSLAGGVGARGKGLFGKSTRPVSGAASGRGRGLGVGLKRKGSARAGSPFAGRGGAHRKGSAPAVGRRGGAGLGLGNALPRLGSGRRGSGGRRPASVSRAAKAATAPRAGRMGALRRLAAYPTLRHTRKAAVAVGAGIAGAARGMKRVATSPAAKRTYFRVGKATRAGFAGLMNALSRRQQAVVSKSGSKVRRPGSENTVSSTAAPVPTPAPASLASTTNQFVRIGGDSMFFVAAHADEMKAAAGAYAPEGMLTFESDLRQLPDALRAIGDSLRIWGQKVEGEFPVDPRVIELVKAAVSIQYKVAAAVEEAPAVFRRIHESDIQRLENPRVGEDKWDVTRNR